MAQSAAARPGKPTYHYLPATADTVHWGYFSKLLNPRIEIDSDVINMLPYIAIMAALVLFARGNYLPPALCLPYVRGGK